MYGPWDAAADMALMWVAVVWAEAAWLNWMNPPCGGPDVVIPYCR
jgi:hypothetical protein